MARTEYYRDAAAPEAEGLVPSAFAMPWDKTGRVLLVRRADDGLWELPGGRIEIGESASAAVIREVCEEAGALIQPTAIAGVYSEPGHILAYADGEVRQQVAICFHAVPRDEADPRPDYDETTAAAWFALEATETLPMHPAMRRRLLDALDQPRRTHFD